MNREKFLPIGSVVLLKETPKRVMINGFLVKSKDNEGKIYDYVGCLYPEGIIDSKKNIVFNHSEIDLIYYLGYQDSEWEKAKITLRAAEQRNAKIIDSNIN